MSSHAIHDPNRDAIPGLRPEPEQQRALRLMLAGVAHDLDCPSAASPEERFDPVDQARRIRRNIERMHALIRQFGAVHRPPAGAGRGPRRRVG